MQEVQFPPWQLRECSLYLSSETFGRTVDSTMREAY